MNGIATRFAGAFENLNEAIEWAKMIQTTDFCPLTYKNKPPSEVVIAVQYGHELGLKPLQSLHGVSVINGKPSVYGDTMLALCRGSKECEYIIEEWLTSEQLFKKYSYDKKSQYPIAVCIVKRKGEPQHISVFSEEDAIAAALLGKTGPWKMYKNRMMQMRARSFGLRDKFADILKGIIAAEEAEDYITTSYGSVESYKELEVDKDTGEILEVKEEIKSAPQEIIDEIASLIAKLEVTDEQVAKWLSKTGVGYINDLSLEQGNRFIQFLTHKLESKSKE